MITRDDILAAAARIEGRVRLTPVIEYAARGLDGRPVDVLLKLECLQHAGSFKPRGAFNTALSELAAPGPSGPPQRLVAASGGNHGLAVAHVGRELGLPTDIFVPAIASPIKVAAIEARGARVHVGGATYAEALAASEALAAETGVLALHAYDTVPTVTGQGTLAAELSQQAPDADTVVVAVGGGGLIGGIASWYAAPETRRRKRQVSVVAVEPEGCPTLHRAMAAGEPVTTPVGGVAADALGASRIGGLGFDAFRRVDGCSIVVGDEQIMSARQQLWRDLRIVVEPAGAAAMAAVLSGSDVGDQIVVVLCGSNTDPGDLT